MVYLQSQMCDNSKINRLREMPWFNTINIKKGLAFCNNLDVRGLIKTCFKICLYIKKYQSVRKNRTNNTYIDNRLNYQSRATVKNKGLIILKLYHLNSDSSYTGIENKDKSLQAKCFNIQSLCVRILKPLIVRHI